MLNRLTNMVDAAGTTSWQYDTANRFTVEDGPWSNDNVTNRWNTAGLRTNLAILQPAGYFKLTIRMIRPNDSAASLPGREPSITTTTQGGIP
jgi:hypothetical protein